MRHRTVALLGLAGMLPIALGLLRESLTVEAASTRALVLLVLCAVVDRVLVPVGIAVLGPPKRREEDRAAAVSAER